MNVFENTNLYIINLKNGYSAVIGATYRIYPDSYTVVPLHRRLPVTKQA